ncbi:hypothetical protein RchiOBHm_Chr2g0164211 [Rosa chinensis]|uniref:Uncharacterized protein n=1 Tax=Rosa chinensis TaxID=74649 RepID=A0A2P6S3H2_ROSCH|nr:hypothetical protein RchiOBHm_Chr2g0164211 [Rosa chinensis]
MFCTDVHVSVVKLTQWLASSCFNFSFSTSYNFQNVLTTNLLEGTLNLGQATLQNL